VKIIKNKIFEAQILARAGIIAKIINYLSR